MKLCCNGLTIAIILWRTKAKANFNSTTENYHCIRMPACSVKLIKLEKHTKHRWTTDNHYILLGKAIENLNTSVITSNWLHHRAWSLKTSKNWPSNWKRFVFHLLQAFTIPDVPYRFRQLGRSSLKICCMKSSFNCWHCGNDYMCIIFTWKVWL